MSQTPPDAPAPASTDEQATNGAAPSESANGTPAPARGRHRRPSARRTSTRTGEAAASPEPATPDAASATPSAAESPTSAPAASEAAPQSESAASAAPSGAPDEAAEAPAPARPARGGRASGRRPGRSRGPQLVAPSRDESQPAGGETQLAQAEEGASAETARAAAVSAADAPALDHAERRAEALGESRSAAPSEPAPRVRRYRFDRPAAQPAAASALLRPERLSRGPETPTAGINAPVAPQAEEPSAPADVLSSGAPTERVEEVPSPEVRAEEALPEAPVDTAETLVALSEEEHEAQEGEGAETAEAAEGAEAGAAEGEAGQAGRRRRRRRRNGSTGSVRHLEAVVPDRAEPEPTPISSISSRPGTRAPFEAPPEYQGPGEPHQGPGAQRGGAYAGPGQQYQVYPPDQQEGWDIASAYQQMGQPRSPFGAPEPNAPRGFGAQPPGVATPFQERTARSSRSDRVTDVPPMTVNHLGSVISQAIQQQTDRLLSEMRHTQSPPSMTVMFPPFPSTERVGVFVDVANLLYSSRSLRVGIDFGHLLEFLRGNRRLVRAHAYAPTNPEPHAEQQFLSVVKGVGYRITTKNYKTFTSGAKKADLDLDLCMDIVRLVDARALDTVVLVSGDSDFLPLLEYCSDHGVRVEVAAFEDAAAAILRQSCDLFINLSLVEDIRA